MCETRISNSLQNGFEAHLTPPETQSNQRISESESPDFQVAASNQRMAISNGSGKMASEFGSHHQAQSGKVGKTMR
jgi:hypothetical protein